jgi:anaerobic selenocysteine-containing dehydrogenase
MMNPSVTQMADAHFLFEAQHNGSELTVIDPQYSATAVHADNWIPIQTGTDAALGLAVARHIWQSGNLEVDYVREQTDFPLLVRLDTGRFLRGQDMLPGAAAGGRDERKQNVLFVWNPDAERAAEAPGSEGADSGKLIVEGFVPPIEGLFQVTLLDGTQVSVTTVASLLKEQLDPWTFEATAEVTKLSPELIEKFADGFAQAERPMILSSWGSNRFLHSDLMNRTKLLCLAMKGAMGKKGAGYQASGFMGMSGFASALQLNRTGTLGQIEMVLGTMSAGKLYDIVVDLVMGRKSQAEIIWNQVPEGEEEMICATNVSTIDYHHQGIAESLNKQVQGLYPRSLDDYVKEAEEKGWQKNLPRGGPPKVYLQGGTNLLRRSNQTQAMLDNLWPKLELAVGIDQKMNFTVMHCDYVLPAAGWYEKPGIKYMLSYVPYLHYCGQAVKPLGESKDEWEIYWLLSKRIQEIAIERNVPVFDGCGKVPVDWKELHDLYSFNGEYGAKDAEAVTQLVLDNTVSTKGMQIEDLKKTGIEKYSSTGIDMSPTSLFNPDWKGEGVLTTLTHFTKYKWRWPTFSGRQQTYIDHPWFLGAGEALPTHKESPKAGGDLPFQLISGHSRWSIHSTFRDTPLLLRLQRGEPVLYLNVDQAEKLGLDDGEFAELYNDLGSMKMKIKHSTMVRPGVAYYFHGWDPTQFPEHKSFKWLIHGLMNPLHMAGGQGHIRFGINHLQSGSYIQDTRIGIRPVESDTVA